MVNSLIQVQLGPPLHSHCLGASSDPAELMGARRANLFRGEGAPTPSSPAVLPARLARKPAGGGGCDPHRGHPRDGPAHHPPWKPEKSSASASTCVRPVRSSTRPGTRPDDEQRTLAWPQAVEERGLAAVDLVPAAELLALELARCGQLQAAAWAPALCGNWQAHQQVLRTIERRARSAGPGRRGTHPCRLRGREGRRRRPHDRNLPPAAGRPVAGYADSQRGTRRAGS